MSATEGTTFVEDYRRLPVALRVLRNPVAIVLATYVAYETIGRVLIGILLVILFIDTPEVQVNRPWSEHGLCGLVHGWQDFEIILCRLFYSKQSIFLFLMPFSLMAFSAWLIQSILARRALWVLTRRQRRIVVQSMYLVAVVALMMGLSRFPTDVLFAGPIEGFHPLAPQLRGVSSFVTPILFWVIVAKLEERYLSNKKDA